MNERFGHVAQRLFNTPLALHPRKAAIVVSAAFERLGYGKPVFEGAARQIGAWFDDDDGFSSARDSVAPDAGYDLVGGAAVIQVSGTLVQKLGSLRPFSGMTGYSGIRQAFFTALADDAVKGILFDIDSGGGEVAGLFDLADAIYAERGEKPIGAVLTENAYSAAYVLASCVDRGRLWVPRTGGVGSAGVICARLDYSQMLEKDGIKVQFVTSGARKADGHPELAITDDEMAALQGEVDYMADLLFETVARNRGLKASEVSDLQAATFLGGLGVERKLADAVAAPDDAFRAFVSSLS